MASPLSVFSTSDCGGSDWVAAGDRILGMQVRVLAPNISVSVRKSENEVTSYFVHRYTFGSCPTGGGQVPNRVSNSVLVAVFCFEQLAGTGEVEAGGLLRRHRVDRADEAAQIEGDGAIDGEERWQGDRGERCQKERE